MKTHPTLLPLCERNPPVTGGLLSQKAIYTSFSLKLALAASWANNLDAGDFKLIMTSP